MYLVSLYMGPKTHPERSTGIQHLTTVPLDNSSVQNRSGAVDIVETFAHVEIS